jgi:hypothetical protein
VTRDAAHNVVSAVCYVGGAFGGALVASGVLTRTETAYVGSAVAALVALRAWISSDPTASKDSLLGATLGTATVGVSLAGQQPVRLPTIVASTTPPFTVDTEPPE